MRLPFKGSYPLTQEFGVNPQYYTQFLVKYPDGSTQPMKGHNGLDFGCPHRTEVIAPHDGEVIETPFDQNGYGNYVKVENDNEGSVLAHLDEINVRVGFKLKEGDHIGWSDNTGYSTGEHLHWGWYLKPRDRNNGIAGYYDQTEELKKSGITIKLNELPVIENSTEDTSVIIKSGKLWTDEEYQSVMNDRNKFWTERDEALVKLKALQKQYDDEHAILTGFQAMGYNTIDDVTKSINKKDEDSLGVKQQLVSALQRNKTLADLLAQKDHEDSKAIEDGLDALEQVKHLQSDIAEITKAVGANKSSLKDVINRIAMLSDFADKWLRKIAYEHTHKEEKKLEKEIQVKQETNESLTSLFGF